MTIPDFVVDNVDKLPLTTRFAPSPTGLLHRGHALSTLLAWRLARAAGGRFILRIEDIDTTRCRPEYEAAILEDLAWLGLDWDGPVWRQSARGPVYAEALDRLVAMGVAYPCFCTRADIAAAASAPHGPEAAIYPGTCRHLAPDERARRLPQETPAWRLDVAAALAITGPLAWHDSFAGLQAADPAAQGDFVVARRDIGTAYALAVVVDDAAQGVTDVVRGVDLFEATHGQRLLQALLGLPAPRYHHHKLVLGADGKRLAKRDRGETLAALRAAGTDPAVLRAALIDPVRYP
ncbi:tRNA glutamyl-Q(34) synthetase GluQRS [Sandarakinorhabdus oryzae]|uniref:tRNA glutamyl-Q(34) synthetase GluQRS n=1 Tax=Sandarakinorhabdus oryzae TaxID=2675220 RepID=UPI0018CC4F60|nr:tRNA glutamyl-Q(34) synthetase GluQRS [Sandarakinorhabdus oryzae]